MKTTYEIMQANVDATDQRNADKRVADRAKKAQPMTEQAPAKLSDQQIKLLQRACNAGADGAPFIGYSGRLATARFLTRAGLADLLVIGGGRMPRIFGTEAGREWMRAHGEKA